jgi:hypothetical protein
VIGSQGQDLWITRGGERVCGSALHDQRTAVCPLLVLPRNAFGFAEQGIDVRLVCAPLVEPSIIARRRLGMAVGRLDGSRRQSAQDLGWSSVWDPYEDPTSFTDGRGSWEPVVGDAAVGGVHGPDSPAGGGCPLGLRDLDEVAVWLVRSGAQMGEMGGCCSRESSASCRPAGASMVGSCRMKGWSRNCLNVSRTLLRSAGSRMVGGWRVSVRSPTLARLPAGGISA